MASKLLKTAKLVTIAYSILLALLGLVVIFYGVHITIAYNGIYRIYISGIITVSIMSTFACFLGCVGAFTGNRSMVLCFVVSSTLILLIELILGAWSFVNYDKILISMEEKFDDLVTGYNANLDLQNIANGIQTWGECCGWNSYTEWEYATPVKYPESCCQEGKLNQTDLFCDTKYFKIGCSIKLSTFLQENKSVLTYLTLSILFIQVFIAVIASYFYGSLHRRCELNYERFHSI